MLFPTLPVADEADLPWASTDDADLAAELVRLHLERHPRRRLRPRLGYDPQTLEHHRAHAGTTWVTYTSYRSAAAD